MVSIQAQRCGRFETRQGSITARGKQGHSSIAVKINARLEPTCYTYITSGTVVYLYPTTTRDSSQTTSTSKDDNPSIPDGFPPLHVPCPQYYFLFFHDTSPYETTYAADSPHTWRTST